MENSLMLHNMYMQKNYGKAFTSSVEEEELRVRSASVK